MKADQNRQYAQQRQMIANAASNQLHSSNGRAPACDAVIIVPAVNEAA